MPKKPRATDSRQELERQILELECEVAKLRVWNGQLHKIVDEVTNLNQLRLEQYNRVQKELAELKEASAS